MHSLIHPGQHCPLRIVFRLTLASIIMLFALGLSPARPAAAYQGGNLLQNPGFEGSYIAINGDSTLRVASNWQPWSLPQGASSAINQRPEYKPAPANRIRSGQAAQEYNTFYATHTGGLYQRVTVAAGTQLQFSAFIYVWSSATFANPDKSEDPNKVIVRVGIDPTGGTDGTSSAIVWSPDTEYYDQWRQVAVTATAASSAVTVFIRTAPQDAIGVNTVYVDDAALVPLSQAQPTATFIPTVPAIPTNPPPPSFTPAVTAVIGVPTQEGTITPLPTSLVPTSTPLPIATAAPTLPSGFDTSFLYTVRAGDTVSGIAQRYGSTIAAIVSANALTNPGLIRIGQVLIIPVNSTTNRPATFTPVPTQPGSSGPVTPGVGTYTVRAGDTLFAIAARFNTTVSVIAQLNNILNPNLIFPGQVLNVPGGQSGPVPTPAPNVPTAVPPTAVPQPTQHVVQAGENLFRISLRYGVTLDALARANGLYNWNLIFPGQVLVIPR